PAFQADFPAEKPTAEPIVDMHLHGLKKKENLTGNGSYCASFPAVYQHKNGTSPAFPAETTPLSPVPRPPCMDGPFLASESGKMLQPTRFPPPFRHKKNREFPNPRHRCLKPWWALLDLNQ
ncbi:MAG: hypothetical protein J6Y19_08400, partial [Kiritimatiellae bacterium]|nr:hypothetical protein [Kiritimatiellia bacterium]